MYSLNRTPLSPCHASPCLHCCRHCWRLALRLSPTQWTTQVLFPGVWWVYHWLQGILTLYSLNVIVFFTFDRVHVHSFLVCVEGFPSFLGIPYTNTCALGMLEAGFLFLFTMDKLEKWKIYDMYEKVRACSLVLDSKLFKLKVRDPKHSVSGEWSFHTVSTPASMPSWRPGTLRSRNGANTI